MLIFSLVFLSIFFSLHVTLIKVFIVILKVVNIGFDGYIGTWILRIYRIYRRYIGGYFYINIGN